MKIAGKVVNATVADNETARDFVSLLPLNLSMNDLFGREKFANLPKALSEEGPRKNRYEVRDIAYWSPNHQVAIYYRQDGEPIPPPRIIPLGKIHIPPDLVVRDITAHRKPPEVRICRLRNQSLVGTIPPSTSTPHCPACLARR